MIIIIKGGESAVLSTFLFLCKVKKQAINIGAESVHIDVHIGFNTSVT